VTERPEPVVAIDGPAGSGKSTASRQLAERLGFVLVDTGAMYRAVALAAHERDVSWEDADGLGAVARGLELRFEPGEGGEPRLILDGADRSRDIRTPEMSQGASKVSAHPPVRDALLGLQRQLGARGGVVLEGRDIGTVVFPDAAVKFYLDASPNVRAERRAEQLREAGKEVDEADVLEQIKARDRRDSTRPDAPLIKPDDAEAIDTSDMSLDEVITYLEERVRRRAGALLEATS